MKILNRLILGALMFVFLGCTSFFSYRPSIAFIVNAKAYGVIEEQKINRKGMEDNTGDKMYQFLRNEYEISFINQGRIEAKKNKDEGYIIKFYDDWKMTVGGKEYIIPKDNFFESRTLGNRYYLYKLPVDIRDTKDMEYILDIGEIEIIDDVDGKVVRKRRKIPPILFKKRYYVAIMYDRMGYDRDEYYRGWAEDFPEDTTTLKRISTTDKTREAVEFPDLKLKK